MILTARSRNYVPKPSYPEAYSRADLRSYPGFRLLPTANKRTMGDIYVLFAACIDSDNRAILRRVIKTRVYPDTHHDSIHIRMICINELHGIGCRDSIIGESEAAPCSDLNDAHCTYIA